MIRYFKSMFGAALLAAIALAPVSAQAKGLPIFYSTGSEKTVTVAKFPQTPDFAYQGQHFDPGVLYKQVSLMFIPLWNYDLEWCGVIDENNVLEISKEELDGLAQAANITLPSEMKIPLWDAIGGKALVLVLLAGGAFYLLGSNKSSGTPARKEEEDETAEKLPA